MTLIFKWCCLDLTCLPLNTVLTVAKYEPMGTTIMAKVKASSLTMTSLMWPCEVSKEISPE